MSSAPPTRILFLRPDTYGDLFIFEPVPRMVRDAWPGAEVGVLIRKPYEDAIPLFPAEGVRWLTTTCSPYRQTPAESRAAIDDLRDVVRAFAPDCVVAACAVQTWLESAVAAFLPEARQVSLGEGLTDPVLRTALDAVLPVDWSRIYPEKIAVEPDLPEWEKNLRLMSALLGHEAPRWWPVAQVPEAARADAEQILAEAGLSAGGYVACAAAGTANVQIKCWPAEHYGGVLAWLERERGLRALLIGHVSEREHLETVRRAAREGGANPALWVGRDGEMPLVAGLLASARFYLGNDTGALHLAAALGRPVVPIFGGGHWPGFQPVARRALTVVQPLPCFGCAWDCHFVDAPCVRTISPASVRRALEQFLRDDSEGQSVFEAEGLDAGARALIHTATPQLRFLREDRAFRGQQITQLTAWLAASEAERAAMGKRLDAKEASGITGRERPASPKERGTPTDADPAITADLRLRLQGSQAQELAARTEARHLARESALARRLLKFSFAAPPPVVSEPRPTLVTRKTAKMPRLRDALRKEKVIFHLDSCQHQGSSVIISGWAFRRAPGWDGGGTTVTLLFHHGVAVHPAATARVLRPEVAAHFAGQPRGLSGGAHGLDGAGFAAAIPVATLPAGVGLEIVLRLECAGRVCEQTTGERLWL